MRRFVSLFLVMLAAQWVFPLSASATHYVHGLPAHRVWVWPHYNCRVVGGADGTVAVTSCIWRGGGWHWKINGAPNP